MEYLRSTIARDRRKDTKMIGVMTTSRLMLADLIWTVRIGSLVTHLVKGGLADDTGLCIASIAADGHWRVGHGVSNAEHRNGKVLYAGFSKIANVEARWRRVEARQDG